jgi:hypothetical protein
VSEDVVTELVRDRPAARTWIDELIGQDDAGVVRTDHELSGCAAELRVDQVDLEAVGEAFDVDVFGGLDTESPQKLICFTSSILNTPLPHRHDELLLFGWP